MAYNTDRQLVFNVLDYGADPTGTNDSVAAFTAAISAKEAAKGGIVFIPSGYYKLLSTIDFGTCGVIQGVSCTTDLTNFGVATGKTGSCLASHVTSGVAVTLGLSHALVNHVVIENLGIFNANITSPNGSTPTPAANVLTGFHIAATQPGMIYMRNVGAYGFGTGLNYGVTEEGTFESNTAFINTVGMTWDNGFDNSKISNPSISYATDGILAISSLQVTIDGGAIQGCTNGLHIQPVGPGSLAGGIRLEEFTVRNVWFEANNQVGSATAADILFDASNETPTLYAFINNISIEHCHGGSNYCPVVFIRNPSVGQQNGGTAINLLTFYNSQLISGATNVVIPSWASYTTLIGTKITGITDNGAQTVIINTFAANGGPSFQIPNQNIPQFQISGIGAPAIPTIPLPASTIAVFDANKGVSLKGGYVTGLADQKNSNNLLSYTAGTAYNNPGLTTINGHSCIYFNGNNWLSGAMTGITAGSGMFIWVVYANDPMATGTYSGVVGYNFRGSGQYLGLYTSVPPNGVDTVIMETEGQVQLDAAALYPSQTIHTALCYVSGTTEGVGVDGTITTGTIAANAFSDGNPFYLGMNGVFGTKGYVFYAIVCNAIPTAPELSALQLAASSIWTGSGSTEQNSQVAFYVDAYGATPCSGSTLIDSTSAIQACFAAAQALAQSVAATGTCPSPKIIFSAGVYYVNNMLQLTNCAGIIIEGAGELNTCICTHGVYGLPAVLRLTNCYHTIVRNMTIFAGKFGFALASPVAIGATSITLTGPVIPSYVQGGGASYTSLSLTRYDYSCGDLVQIPTTYTTASTTVPLSVTPTNPYAAGDYFWTSSANCCISVYSDNTITKLRPSSQNKFEDVVCYAQGCPFGISVSCAGGVGSSSDADNEDHIFDDCEVLYASVASFQLIGINALDITVRNMNFNYSPVAVLANSGSMSFDKCGFEAAGPYSIEITNGGQQSHAWHITNVFPGDNGFSLKSTANFAIIEQSNVQYQGDLTFTTSTFSGSTVSISSAQKLRAGQVVSINGAPTSLSGEYLTIASVLPGVLNGTTTSSTVTFTTSPVNSYPVGSSIFVPWIYLSGYQASTMVSNCNFGSGANAGAWLYAQGIAPYNLLTEIDLVNCMGSLSGFTCDNAILRMSNTIIDPQIKFTGCVNCQELYLNNGRMYSDNHTHTPLGHSGLLTSPYWALDDQVATLVNGANNNVDVFSPNGSITINGPTAAFSITGIIGRPGTTFDIVVLPTVNQTLTIANLSSSSSAGNRILTGTGANLVITPVSSSQPIYFRLIYKPWVDSGSGGWVLVNHTP